MIVIKRDGSEVSFDKKKIENAINNAFLEVDGQLYETDTAYDIASEIEDFLRSSSISKISIEDVQDMVIEKLLVSERPDVATSYIKYRDKRSRIRNKNSALMKAYSKKLRGQNIENQNANVDEQSFGGRKGEADSIISKQLALDDYMSKLARENHENNIIYTHDLDNYAVGMHNCLSVPLDKLLANGFKTRQTDVRPAGSVSTAMQLVAVIFQLQSLQQFGGVSATHLDWTMVPYVRKSFYKHFTDGTIYFKYSGNKKLFEQDAEEEQLRFDYCYKQKYDKEPGDNTKIIPEQQSIFYNYLPSFDPDRCTELEKLIYNYAMDMTEKEVHQAVEGLYHNLNTLQSRSGNQLPFTSINYGTCTLPEGRMITKALLEVSIEGLGANHRTSVFPCGIFQVAEGINKRPGDPNYDLFRLALKSTAQRLYPNYANVDWSGNAGYDKNDPTTFFSTMGCRTANGWDINGFGQKKDGRGNICPVTIIMPTVAMIAKEMCEEEGQEEDLEVVFLNLLNRKIYEAKDILIERFEHICAQGPESARFMYENGLMEGYIPEEGIRSALKHGTLAIGNLGLAETLQILIGKDHTTEEGMELAKKIYSLFKEKCSAFKEEYRLNFGVYNTPAENLCYTAMKKFRDKYGIIKNVSDKDFFTNSMHVPVWREMSPFQKIDIESQLTGYSSAGCITYVELDSTAKNNLDALETLVVYAMDKDIPYFAINVPNDSCLDCGYTDEFNDHCPQCNSENIQQLRRVTGYLTGNYKTAFNKGKQQEVEMRVKHK